MDKKGIKMKKLTVTALSALLFLALLISCGPKSSNASPGNLTSPTAKPVPHESTGEEDVSSSFYDRLCTDYWLDTNSMHLCRLNQDGSYYWLESKKDQDQLSAGRWRITRDDQSFLTLYLTDDLSGEELVLHEMELYDTSIYAVNHDGNAIVWLISKSEN